MKVGCNLLWLVPGSVGGTEPATVAQLREMAVDPPDDLEIVLFGLDALGQVYPDLVESFPTHLVPLAGRMRPVRVAAENSWLIRRLRAVDMVHHMGGTLPALKTPPALLTIHDLQPFDMPENFTATKRHYLQRSVPRSVRRARSVLVPTEFVRRSILDRFDLEPDRVRLTPWGVEPPSTQVSVAQVQARYGLPRRWFVYPSFTWNHKNHGLLLRAFAAVASREHDVMLVLTGGEGPAERHVRDQISAMGLRGRVRRTGLIPRRDVLAITRGAVAMTWPSRYEGFGLPILEAMSLGTPVVSSDVTALPEVAGGAAVLLSPDDPDAWEEAMTRMLHDGDERQRLTDLGRRHVAAFTWRRSADAVLSSYRALAADMGGAGATVGRADDGDPDAAGDADAAGDPDGAGDPHEETAEDAAEDVDGEVTS